VKNDTSTEPAPERKPGYEPPQVERVMDADELAREVHYAGDFVPVSR
jgi:hypothetical protein